MAIAGERAAGRGLPGPRGNESGQASVELVAILPALILCALVAAHGVAAGWARYAGPSAPDLSRLVQAFPLVMVHAGLGLAAAVLWILGHWAVALWSVARPAQRPDHAG